MSLIKHGAFLEKKFVAGIFVLGNSRVITVLPPYQDLVSEIKE